MNKREKAQRIQLILNTLFPKATIPLKHQDPFTLLIAVLLSAQCSDARVNRVTPKLFAKASSPQEMSRLSVKEIEECIRPLGLFRTKARRIQALSAILATRYKGQVPATLKALEALPGVGHKTASVVLTQAFSKAAFPVDRHIHRLSKRWGLSSGNKISQTERALKRIFPKKSWKTLHLQLILYARAYCPARGHRLFACPICRELKFKK
ncbi:MAG TPA: endonuclease III [Parachlamydiales bacterium]|nr:MAG: endonuclease III [Chlamydiae bacterium GWA2_50_15]OGN57470.1 MAG: endonuclease III [Chlamydiae bacterium RIFCSPHIGHO2_02_FULL_49_29]OGN64545.1 MAG: endonuclease III [Chlamydiae bacterium RIFCSPHIGHO2_12_FULL_49_32]OGN70814.1 MAG: endonuclease III [Chlamydiae bacterium RIFCSPLOWO2_02_FULL_49_12]OGN73334.1 MAG: endonuclease III [Chlamydiae bacterium RIFCSPLOWO2_12_FULL_49_12]HAZ15267.1 endonuclease III [Parachlamydiales bacterium]